MHHQYKFICREGVVDWSWAMTSSVLQQADITSVPGIHHFVDSVGCWVLCTQERLFPMDHHQESQQLTPLEEQDMGLLGVLQYKRLLIISNYDVYFAILTNFGSSDIFMSCDGSIKVKGIFCRILSLTCKSQCNCCRFENPTITSF